MISLNDELDILNLFLTIPSVSLKPIKLKGYCQVVYVPVITHFCQALLGKSLQKVFILWNPPLLPKETFQGQ